MPKRGYHHGNLREALINGCLTLIEKRGPTGFTLSEAAREAAQAHFGVGGDALLAVLRGID